MRLPLMCSFIASTLLAAACGGPGGPKTTQEVGDTVLAALVAKDWTALKGLYVTPDVIMSACAQMPADKLAGLTKEFAEEATEAEEKFKKCLDIDWTGAKISAVSGGEAKKPVEGCGGKVVQSSDIELKVEVGAKKYDVKVNDPALIEGHYALIEGVRCKAPELSCDDIYANMVKIVATATDAKEGEKDMFSGAADKKAEFAKMCGEMRGNATFASILTCVGDAKSYADMKACEDKAKADAAKELEAAPAENMAAAAPAVPGAPGDDPCAKYFAKFSACVEAMPEAQRDPMKKGLDSVKAAMAGRTPEETKLSRNAARGAAKQSLAQLCPSVNWD